MSVTCKLHSLSQLDGGLSGEGPPGSLLVVSGGNVLCFLVAQEVERELHRGKIHPLEQPKKQKKNI